MICKEIDYIEATGRRFTMYVTMQGGWIEVICGSMFSGKSEELIRRIRRSQFAKQKIAVFKPEIDDRFSEEAVVSHNGTTVIANPIASSTILRSLSRMIMMSSQSMKPNFLTKVSLTR